MAWPPKRRVICRVALPVEDDVEGLTVFGGLHLAPVEVEIYEGLSLVILYKCAADVALIVGQRVVPQKIRELLVELLAWKHTHRESPSGCLMAEIQSRGDLGIAPLFAYGLVPYGAPGDAVSAAEFQADFRCELGKEICLGRRIVIVPLAVVENRLEVNLPCELLSRSSEGKMAMMRYMTKRD